MFRPTGLPHSPPLRYPAHMPWGAGVNYRYQLPSRNKLLSGPPEPGVRLTSPASRGSVESRDVAAGRADAGGRGGATCADAGGRGDALGEAGEVSLSPHGRRPWPAGRSVHLFSQRPWPFSIQGEQSMQELRDTDRVQ